LKLGLCVVLTDAETPLLPLDKSTCELEARTVRLDDLEGLQSRPRRFALQGMVILWLLGVTKLIATRQSEATQCMFANGSAHLPGTGVLGRDRLGAEWQVTDLNNLHLNQVDDRHEVERESIVVRVGRVVLGAAREVSWISSRSLLTCAHLRV
jgi:hypothetical protein